MSLPNLKKFSCAFSLLFFVLATQQVQAQDFSPDPDWKVSVYLWTMGLDGDIGIGPINADIDVSFSDILDQLDYGGSVVFRRDWGRNVLVFDLSYFS